MCKGLLFLVVTFDNMCTRVRHVPQPLYFGFACRHVHRSRSQFQFSENRSGGERASWRDRKNMWQLQDLHAARGFISSRFWSNMSVGAVPGSIHSFGFWCFVWYPYMYLHLDNWSVLREKTVFWDALTAFLFISWNCLGGWSGKAESNDGGNMWVYSRVVFQI